MGEEFVFQTPGRSQRNEDRPQPTNPPNVGIPDREESSSRRRQDAESSAVCEPIVIQYPDAGLVLQRDEKAYASWTRQEVGKSEKPFGPFSTQLDYEVGKWAKELGPGDTALTKLLAIPGVRQI